MKPRILHIIDTLTKGGAEVLLSGVINELKDYEHLILYLSPTRNPIIETQAGLVKVVCLNYNNILDSRRIVAQLNVEIKDFKPQIIHTHLYFSSILIRFANTKFSRVIQTYHGVYYRIKYTKRKARIIKYFMKLFDRYTMKSDFKIIHVSKTQQEINDFDINIKSSVVLHNYIEDTFFSTRSSQLLPKSTKLRIISVGNLKTEKNHILLLKALRCLTHIPLHVNIYGQGNDERMLQAYINKYNLPVTIQGSQENVSELLDQHHLFISCSIIEGFGISVAEAMASEIPMIISDISTFKEITQNQACFFESNNEKDLARKIEGYYLNPQSLKQSVDMCKKVGEAYNKKTYFLQLSKIYQEVIIRHVG